MAGIVGPNAVDFAIDPDSDIQWPANPPPFILIVPKAFSEGPEDIGGGRFVKTYECNLDIHIIVQNIYDISYKDTILTTSNDSSTGIYTIVDQVINAIEQSYVVDPSGQLRVVELPYATSVAQPARYKGSNEYSVIVVDIQGYRYVNHLL